MKNWNKNREGAVIFNQVPKLRSWQKKVWIPGPNKSAFSWLGVGNRESIRDAMRTFLFLYVITLS